MRRKKRFSSSSELRPYCAAKNHRKKRRHQCMHKNCQSVRHIISGGGRHSHGSFFASKISPSLSYCFTSHMYHLRIEDKTQPSRHIAFRGDNGTRPYLLKSSGDTLHSHAIIHGVLIAAASFIAASSSCPFLTVYPSVC